GGTAVQASAADTPPARTGAGAGAGTRTRACDPTLGVRRAGVLGQLVGTLAAATLITAGERLGDASERFGELRWDDEHLVGVALGELRQHLQVLVTEQLRVGIARVDRLEHSRDRLRFAFGLQDRRLL